MGLGSIYNGSRNKSMKRKGKKAEGGSVLSLSAFL